jgi:hypothetical protein
MRTLEVVAPLLLFAACGRGLPRFGPPIEAPSQASGEAPIETPTASAFPASTPTAAVAFLPDVSATKPLNDAHDVGSGQRLEVTFNEAMDPATLTAGTFSVKQGDATVAGHVSYDAASRTATFAPAVPLSGSYNATVDADAKSAPGGDLAAPFSWSFTTRPAETPVP